jgi:hypothetical protein
MNHKTLIILLLLFPAFMVSCEKDNGDRTWVYCNETQCSNTWDNISLDSAESRVEEYLKRNGIRLFDITIERYSYGPFCTACDCPSGRAIQVLILDTDVEAIKKLGFNS